MSHFFTTGVMKTIYQKKQEKNVSLNIVIKLNFCNEKVIFIVFYVKEINKLVSYNQQLKPAF